MLDQGLVGPYIVNKFYCFQLSSDPFQPNDSMVCALIDELQSLGLMSRLWNVSLQSKCFYEGLDVELDMSAYLILLPWEKFKS